MKFVDVEIPFLPCVAAMALLDRREEELFWWEEPRGCIPHPSPVLEERSCAGDSHPALGMITEGKGMGEKEGTGQTSTEGDTSAVYF